MARFEVLTEGIPPGLPEDSIHPTEEFPQGASEEDVQELNINKEGE